MVKNQTMRGDRRKRKKFSFMPYKVIRCEFSNLVDRDIKRNWKNWRKKIKEKLNKILSNIS